MSRYEGKLVASEETKVAGDLPALLSLFVDRGSVERSAQRQEAIICLLNAAEGWRDARERVGGAFAGRGTGLSAGKEE